MSFEFTGVRTSLGRGGGDACVPNTCLIVEDQALIGLALEAYLEEMGFEVHEPLSSAAAALEWLSGNTPTVAIVDYSLRDGSCLKLVRVLRDRDIPFVIYSGHERSIAPPEFQQVPWINKPCDREVLLAALTRAAVVEGH